jgi:succinate dehydrogenase / fumarate reductase iron-sulfur subunit
MSQDLPMRVWRGDATGGGFVDYTVPVEEGEVVLDAIHRLQATQAGDLAVRWNCKAGKCGSCSAEINGHPRLMCMTRLSTFEPGETITVNPMRTFPVIRDLVTDVSFNFEKARQVPAFAPPSDNTGGKFRMQQVDVDRSQEFRKCIECFLCQNTCHVIRDHEENKPSFAGPRFFIRYAELDMHPLDTQDRQPMVQADEGLGYCNITKCCTDVCPENIRITDNAIIPMKERVVDTRYDPVLFLGSKIGLRKGAGRTPVGPVAGAGPSPIRHPEQAAGGEAYVATDAEPGAESALRKAALPAAAATSGAAGVGVLAWLLRRRRTS